MKKTIAVLLTILMFFSLFQGTLRENVVKAQGQPIWPMFGYKAQHTGRCPYDTSKNNGTLKWQYKTGDKIYSSPAIASDGTIYVGSNDAYLYAVNPDGTLKWKYKTDCPISGSSPAIASDGTIYVGSGDAYLYAINPDGTLKWKYKTGNWIYSSPAVASDGTIYVGSGDHNLYAIGIGNITIILQIGKSTFTVNGESRTLDAPPIIKNRRTLLPIRAIIEALGGTVNWDATNKKVTVSFGSNTIELWIGKDTAKVNGADAPIDPANFKVVPEIINGRTMLPLRFVTENLGCTVQWDQATQKITITYQRS